MTATVEKLGRDYTGQFTDFSLPTPPLATQDIPLETNTINSTVVPTSPVGVPNYNRAFFSFDVGTNVWVTYDGSDPAVPDSNITSTQEKNPAIRQIKPGMTLKFISDGTSGVNIRYDIGQVTG